jgi:hypothetical protein
VEPKYSVINSGPSDEGCQNSIFCEPVGHLSLKIHSNKGTPAVYGHMMSPDQSDHYSESLLHPLAMEVDCIVKHIKSSIFIY